jgi:hypothetical protein
MSLLLLNVAICLSFFDINCTPSSESMASSYFMYKGRLKHLPMLPSPVSSAPRKKVCAFDAIFKANYFLWATTPTPVNKVACFPSSIFILTSPNPCFSNIFFFCRFSIFYRLQSHQENANTFEVETSCEYPLVDEQIAHAPNIKSRPNQKHFIVNSYGRWDLSVSQCVYLKTNVVISVKSEMWVTH